jgi:signal transduction histidine kinase
VQDVTAAALMISIENLSGRLPVPETSDEVARLARVLNSMLERLESAVTTLSQFAADASHELRTPLAVIRTTAELALRRGRSPESYRESLQAVVSEAERMTQLVEDLLALARSDKAVSGMPLMPVDLRDILQAVRTEMKGLAEAHHIDVILTRGEEAAIVSGNRPALHRLFVLLLDNAIKYSYSSGEVKITLDQLDGRVTVTIRDTGTGIPKEDLPHIFERFYRSDRARSGGGHGLGLPLAETIARAHQATIEVRSTEGQGSTFEVKFLSRQPTADPAALLDGARAARERAVTISDKQYGETTPQ